MSSIKAVFLFLFLSLVLTQGTENPEKPSSNTNETKETTTTTDEIIDEEIEQTNRTTTNRTYSRRRPEYDKFRPFNLSFDEMDKMIFCTFVIQNTLRDKKTDLENVQKKMNLSSPNMIYEKLGTDMFEKCNKNADINIVNKYVKNLTYFDNFKLEKSFKSLVDIDFDKYNNQSDLVLTMDQQVLMYKYQSVEEVFRQKRADQREAHEQENQKIKIGSLELDQIPSYVKFTAFLVVLLIIFGGIFYFLKTLEKKPKDKKKNKKKKTQ
jgi:preprotein translocase subunit SecG